MTLDSPSATAIETPAVKPDAQAKAERDAEDALAALLDDLALVSPGEADPAEGAGAADTVPRDESDAPADAALENALLDGADALPAGAAEPGDPPAESTLDDALPAEGALPAEDADAASETPSDPVEAPADTAFEGSLSDAADTTPETGTVQLETGTARIDDPEDDDSDLAFADALLEDIDATPADESAPADAAADADSGDAPLQMSEDAPPAAPDGAGEAAEADLAFEDVLLEEIDAAPAASSDQADESADTGLILEDALARNMDAASDEAFIESDEPAPGDDPGFQDTLLEDTAGSPPGSAEETYGDAQLDAIPIGPAAALAFATDAETEMALRDGLFGFEGSSPGCGEAQVWQGDIRAAIGAIAGGQSAELIFVDIDGISYPAGAIYELAAVCELGTVVIAVGSDGSARPGRELLLAGVSDYLAKPLTADAVRKAAEGALAVDADDGPSGCAAGFVGAGGCGTTTLAAAVAIHAAARGCYVSVLDLGRSVAAAAFSLGVEPAAGLDQLLETAEREEPESEMVDGVRVRRTERIEVYAHRWSPTQPPAPPAEALDHLIAALKHRSKLVLVDGLDLLALGYELPSALNTRILVSEPTAGRAARTARMMQMLGADSRMLFVQNHTRAFKSAAGTRNFRNAGIESEPDVVVPFESALPDIADRGWPHGRLPRSLREPLTALTDRILGSLGGGPAPLRPPQES